MINGGEVGKYLRLSTVDCRAACTVDFRLICSCCSAACPELLPYFTLLVSMNALSLVMLTPVPLLVILLLGIGLTGLWTNFLRGFILLLPRLVGLVLLILLLGALSIA